MSSSGSICHLLRHKTISHPPSIAVADQVRALRERSQDSAQASLWVLSGAVVP